jgi:hypothetical protein
MSDKEYVPAKEIEDFQRMYFPRISLRRIEVPFSWSSNPNYHTLDEVRRIEKPDKISSSEEQNV